jgi:hypothetical protein
MSTALREGITRLEVTSRVTLAVLALASGVYTYLGVRELLNGNATVVFFFFAAVIYSVAVSVGIYAFWSFLMRLLPHVLDYDGHYCASSCPLVFAGGVERRAGEKSAIGVHQVTAVGVDGATPANGMESVQRISAECQRYLRDMGINQLVWIHAMETPKDALFYFKPAELLSLKLATPRAASPATASAGAQVKS